MQSPLNILFQEIRQSLKKINPIFYIGSFILATVFIGRERQDWFTCEGTSDKHVLNHCLLEYENGPNGVQPWIYALNVAFPCFFIAIVSWLVSRKKNKVITMENCAFHINQYSILMFLVLFLYHLFIVGMIIYLWTWNTFKLTMDSPYVCSIAKSSYNCIDGNARLFRIINIGTGICSIGNALLSFHLFWKFWEQWRSQERKRSDFEIEEKKCRECYYYIWFFDETSGKIQLENIFKIVPKY